MALEQKETYSIQDLNDMFRNGSATCSSVVNFYLDRIEKYDKNGPRLNSIIELNPEAKTEALKVF
jgi:amidase